MDEDETPVTGKCGTKVGSCYLDVGVSLPWGHGLWGG